MSGQAQSSTLEIRRPRPSDAAAILRIRRAVLGERRFFITEPEEFRDTIDDQIREIRALERATNSLFLIARRDAELVGLLTVRGGALNRMRHTGKLEVMVLASARGHGVGHALLEAAIAWAQAHPEIEKLGLSVFVDNTRAVELYRRHGFREEGRRPREYRLEDGRYVDDLLMYRFTDGG